MTPRDRADVKPLDFSFAGLAVRIAPPGNQDSLIAPEEYRLFIRPPGEGTPDALYQTCIGDTRLPAVPPTPPVWDNGLWRTRHAVETGLDIDIYDTRSALWHHAARMPSDFSTGTLLCPPPPMGTSGIRPLYHPQDRAVILGRLCHLGGLMMHASSVLVDGKVLVFAGKSGTGKTTIARLWRDHGATLLNDERTLIRPRLDHVHAGASPWHGEENKVDPTTGRLAAIFFLNQDSTNRLHPLPLRDSLPSLLTTTFLPVFLPDGAARTLESAHAILESVPSFGLDFTPDARALNLCRSVL